MKENIINVLNWIKEQKVKGCITGSILLDIFPDEQYPQDVDFFAYSEAAFTQMFYAMYHNPMFQILDPLEKWKADKFIQRKLDNYNKTKLITIKFNYNTCIPVNIVYKSYCTDGYSVISSFDMDVITKCYDTFIQQEIDLTYGSTVSKIVSWNKHNQNFYDPELWAISRILRQLERVIKYHKRGYNTDLVVYKYIELIDGVQEFQNIFNSDNFSEKLKIRKNNTKIIKEICIKWLETHTISDETLELLKEKIKEI